MLRTLITLWVCIGLCIITTHASTLEMESTTDLYTAAELALLNEQAKVEDPVWYVKTISVVAPLPVNETVAPFANAGLYPALKPGQAPQDPKKDPAFKAALEAARKADAEQRAAAAHVAAVLNAKAAPANASLLVPATVLPKAVPNPLLPQNYSTTVEPIPATDLAKLKPVAILGVPDKLTQPLEYREYMRQQDMFAYVGLHPVGKRGNHSRRYVAAPQGVLAPAKVIGKEYVPGAVPTIAPQDRPALTLQPVIMPGVVAPPPAVPVAPAPFSNNMFPPVPSYVPNPPQPVPGASFVETSAWNSLTAGVVSLFQEAMEEHKAAGERLAMLSQELANAVEGEAPQLAALIVSAESARSTAEDTAEQAGEIAEHHELAQAQGIPQQFNFARASRLLTNGLRVANAEHAEVVGHLEDKINLIQAAMEDAAEVDADAEIDTEAEAETEGEAEAEGEAETNAEGIPIAAIPVATNPYYAYLNARMAAFAPKADNANVWDRIEAVTSTEQQTPVVRALAFNLQNAREDIRPYYQHYGKNVARLAEKVQNLLNKIAYASSVERRVALRALNPKAYRLLARRARVRSASAEAAKRSLAKGDALINRLESALREIDSIRSQRKASASTARIIRDAERAVRAADALNTPATPATPASQASQGVYVPEATVSQLRGRINELEALVAKLRGAAFIESPNDATAAPDAPVAAPAPSSAASATTPTTQSAASPSPKSANDEKPVAEVNKPAVQKPTGKLGGKKGLAAKKVAKKAAKKVAKKAAAKKTDSKKAGTKKAAAKKRAAAKKAGNKLLGSKSGGKSAGKKRAGKFAGKKAAGKLGGKKRAGKLSGKKIAGKFAGKKRAGKLVGKSKKQAGKSAASIRAKVAAKLAAKKAAKKQAAEAAKKPQAESAATAATGSAAAAAGAASATASSATAAALVELSTACPRARAVLKRCELKGASSPLCRQARVAVESDRCQSFFIEQAGTQSVEFEPILSAEDRALLSSFLEVDVDVEVDSENEAEAEAEAESEAEDFAMEEDVAESTSIADDISHLAEKAFAEEGAVINAGARTQARHRSTAALQMELPTAATYATPDEVAMHDIPTPKPYYNPVDTLSQISQAWDEQNAIQL